MDAFLPAYCVNSEAYCGDDIYRNSSDLDLTFNRLYIECNKNAVIT